MRRITRRIWRSQSVVLVALLSALEGLPLWFYRRGSQFAVDAFICAISVYAVFLIRFDFNIPPRYSVVMWLWVALLPFLRIVSMWGFGVYNGIWRYFDARDAIELGFAALPASAVMFTLRVLLTHKNPLLGVPIGVIIMEFGVFLAMAVGVRMLRRITHEMVRSGGSTRKRTLLIGTDATLTGALRHISMYGDVQVIGLLAPEAKLHGLRIGGHLVFGDPAVLPQLLAEQRADLILVAEANMECLPNVVTVAMDFNVDLRLLPSAANVMLGDVRVNAPVKPEDAFQQTIYSHADAQVTEAFRDRVILITGAGGSIGSEISRQVAKLPASKVILFDQDENATFEIHNELKPDSQTELIPVVGDIRDRQRVRSVFAAYRPHVVLHAAAYKHVPMMEVNCSEAVLNNVIGTGMLAQAAIEFQAERFLMISSDKAVNPTSVMGATKRLAEIVVQHHAAMKPKDCGTRFGCVRFGNVAGSRGSVIPIFLRQIAAGEPLTITDEQMTRYFMTIPEAVQLVLQSSTLATDGEVYMLDMGDPVKITDLARRLIIMSGLRPGKDVPIQFVGIRSGEKLHEELWTHDASVRPTPFPRVFQIQADAVPHSFGGMLQGLQELASGHRDVAVFEKLCSMPINFRRQKSAQGASA